MSRNQPLGENTEESEQSTLQLDVYGCKLKTRPSRPDEPEPKSLKALQRAIAQKLRNIALHLFGTVEDAFKATRSLLRGVGDLGRVPGAVARRIDRAHSRVDSGEDQEQANIDAGTPPKQTTSGASHKVIEIVEELRGQGIPIRIVAIAPGIYTVV